MGGPWACLGGALWGLEGAVVDPRGIHGDHLLQTGGLVKSMVLQYEGIYFGCRRDLGDIFLEEVVDQSWPPALQRAAEWSAHPVAVLGSLREKWGAVWNATDEPRQERVLSVLPPFLLGAPHSADNIVRVAKSFKTQTCKPDGVVPRHYVFLQELGLTARSKLLFFVDAVGDAPRQ